MKHLSLILVFFYLQIFSQIGKPDFRCIEVLPNSFAKLTWLPPADPSNQFISYDVYFSVTKLGSYTSLNANISSIFTNTFVNPVTTHSVQSCYYFVLCKYHNGSQIDSTRSDTLASIYLNAVPATIDLNLRFNRLHNPAPPSSAPTFTVRKEFPIGNWYDLAVTSATTYPDTIDVCRALMNFSVIIADQSGCFSTSNFQGPGPYEDTKKPEEPYIDSISVLPDGTTCLGWQIPVDRDIVYYRIFYKEGIINQKLDSVPGRNSTFYVYNSTSADTMAVGLFVAAGDSCKKEGTPYYNQSTMFLRTYYDRCAYRSILRWNPYRWYIASGKPRRATKEYRVYYSTDGINYDLIGTTKDTNFVHENVKPGSNVSYFVRVVSEGAPVTASSNRARFLSGQTGSPGFVYLSAASVVNKTSNEIRILIDSLIPFKSLEIQRAETDTSFKLVEHLPYRGGMRYTYLDENLQTTSKNYAYRIVVRDSCNNPRASSNIAKTILLRVKESETDLYHKHLTWSTYEGFATGVKSYRIFRVINDVIDPNPVGNTDALTFTFVDNLEEISNRGAKIDYRVQALENSGNLYGIEENVFSNPAAVYMEGGLFVPNAFAPSGQNSTWLPVTYFVEKTEYHVSVFNRWGKKVFETQSDSEVWDGAGCPPDVYVYLIDYKNSRGEYMQIKGNVMLIR